MQSSSSAEPDRGSERPAWGSRRGSERRGAGVPRGQQERPTEPLGPLPRATLAGPREAGGAAWGACAARRLRHQTGGRSEFGVTAPSAAAGRWGARGGPRCSTSRRHGQAGQGGQLSRDPGALARLRLLLDSEFTQLEDAPVILPGKVTSGLGAPRRKEVTSLLGSTSPKRLRSVGQSRLQPPGRKNIKTPGGHKSWGKGDPQVTGTQSSHTGGSGCLSPTRGLNTEHALTSASFETALGLGTRPSRARPRKTHPTPRAGGARVLGCLARALEGQPPGLLWGAGRAGLGGTSGQGPAASANVARAVTWPWRAAAWAPTGPSGAKLPTDGSCPFRDVALAAVT